MGERAPELRKEAEEFWFFIVHLVFDTLKNLALLAALSAIFFFAKWLKELGIDENDLKHIQDLHFWLTYAALLWIGFVFVVKLLMRGLK